MLQFSNTGFAFKRGERGLKTSFPFFIFNFNINLIFLNQNNK
ncbi:conserved hypothetical protein (plasmid) [Borreliella burgdorferi ZS7]|uniref:Uncharacterized protein n=1 Tax=Borreliella burgdorferi (strain ZS7) TaxID=445985 RepID=A0A0H3C0M1_BORBZ|nr:conserved hypothetical protein [Borreliella burgdorferi ZS7]